MAKMRCAGAVLLLLLGFCALAFAAPSDKQCFTCITFNMAKRAGLVAEAAEPAFCANVKHFVDDECDSGCSDYTYGAGTSDKSCADIVKDIRTAAASADYFKEPAVRKCIAIGLCSKADYGKSLDVPADKDYLPRQAFLHDVVAFRAHYYQLPHSNDGVAAANLLVQNAGLTINFDCGIANLLKTNDEYKNGWQVGALNSDFNVVDETIVGQSRYQKEVWGLNFYGEIQGGDPTSSWRDHREYVDQVRTSAWMTDEIKKERPKYAGVNMFNFIQGYNPIGATAYGRCVFHLNSGYRDIATLTSQDTLSLGVLDNTFNNRRFSCLGTFDKPDTIYAQDCKSQKYLDNPTPLPATGLKVYERLDAASHFTKASSIYLEEKTVSVAEYLPAYEAQIFGQIPLDGAHIDKLACDFRTNFGTDAGKEVMALAEIKGLPLVFYDQGLDISNVQLDGVVQYVAKTAPQVWNVRELGPFVCTPPHAGEGCLFASYPELKNGWAKAKVEQDKRVDPNQTDRRNKVTLEKHLVEEKAMRVAMRKIFDDIASVPALKAQSALLKSQRADTRNPFKKIHLTRKRSGVNSKLKKLTKL